MGEVESPRSRPISAALFLHFRLWAPEFGTVHSSGPLLNIVTRNELNFYTEVASVLTGAAASECVYGILNIYEHSAFI